MALYEHPTKLAYPVWKYCEGKQPPILIEASKQAAMFSNKGALSRGFSDMTHFLTL